MSSAKTLEGEGGSKSTPWKILPKYSNRYELPPHFEYMALYTIPHTYTIQMRKYDVTVPEVQRHVVAMM